jgi:hypothetical protein
MTLPQIAPLPIPSPPSEQSPESLTAAIIGVTVLSLLGLLAAGMTFLRRYRRANAATLQARVAEAIAADVECARVDVVTAAGPTASMPGSVTLEGVVASAAARDRALHLAEAAARRVEPQATVIDHLTVEADRAA